MSAVGRRVVVTGIGVATALGVGREALVRGLSSQASVFAPLEGRLGLVSPGSGAVLDLPRKEYKNWFDPRVLRLSTMTRQTTLGCIACGALLRDAGCAPDGTAHLDKGAYLGSFILPPDLRKQFIATQLLAHRPDGEPTGWLLDDAGLATAMKKASAFDFLRALPNMPSSHLSIQTGYQGPACTYLGSDSSGLQAIIMAVGAIRSGLADAMVAGGAFCPFQEVHLTWQGQRGLWSSDGRVRPFAADATGTLPGEGAGLLYLEELEAAQARGATILAEVTGAGQRVGVPGTDEEVGLRADALRAAMPDGSPDLAAPTAIGHRELDRLEDEAWAVAFGDDVAGMAAVTAVPQVGFTGPATAPINAAAALLASLGDWTPTATATARAGLGAALGRTPPSGDGTSVLVSSFSLDGVHAALAMRTGGPR